MRSNAAWFLTDTTPFAQTAMPDFDSRFHLLILVVVLHVASSCCGQEAAPSAIVATGEASLELPATRMIVVVDLFARHRDVDGAVKLMQDRIEAATAQMTALGADAESMRLADPRISPAQAQTHEALHAQIMEGFNRAGRDAEEAPGKPIMTVTARMTAEFALRETEPIDRMAEAHQLQQRIRRAELSGASDTSGLTPEEQELLEEAEMMGSNNYSDEEQPGTPQFLFVADVSDEDHAATMKRAFADAKQQAAQLADAAGVSLGALHSLKSTSDSESASRRYGYGYSYGSMDYLADELAASILKSDADVQTAFGPEVGTLKHSIRLSAGFLIEQ